MIGARFAALIFGGAATLALAACERPAGMEYAQTGFRGSGQAQVTNPRLIAAASVIPPPPYPLEPDTGGERARDVYENVQVLGHLSPDEFNRLMISITEWVAPEGKIAGGGCNYCHNPENMASEEKYTYKVARRMIQMTLNTNANWKSHVQNTGVTCWTCHRGNPVPANVWTLAEPDNQRGMGIVRGNKRGQNTPDPTVQYASLPSNSFASYLQGGDEIRVASNSGYPGFQNASIKDAESSYGLMMHMSGALGVNCTYCHNSQSFRSWPQSSAQRGVAYYGLRMTRNINDQYITPLTPIFPINRKGPAGDPAKVNCTTCHQGVAKPLNGVSMLPDHPALGDGGASLIRASARVDPIPGVSLEGAESAMARITATTPAGVRLLAADASMTADRCNAAFQGVLGGAEVRFATDSATIDPASRPLLDRLATVAGRCSGYALAIEGHTDVTGSQATNLPLSRDRAGSVANYLVGRGVRPAQLSAVGYGESRPKASREGEARNAVNRRIEMTVSDAPARSGPPTRIR